jgi:hypothetical protein
MSLSGEDQTIRPATSGETVSRALAALEEKASIVLSEAEGTLSPLTRSLASELAPAQTDDKEKVDMPEYFNGLYVQIMAISGYLTRIKIIISAVDL